VKISNIAIKNYRSIQNLDLPVSSYTALVGANGTGKSSVLYALAWFFDGGILSLEDVHGHVDGVVAEDGQPAPRVEVTVTFEGLTDRDRRKLEKYGRGSTATFTRFWSADADKDKVVGNSIQGPGFVAVRNDALIGVRRAAYRTLRETVSDLPALPGSPSKDDMVAALLEWEEDSANAARLEVVNADDANHLFGVGGTHAIKECVRMVLVPAATDISTEVGAAKKGTALDALIGSLMTTAGAQAKQDWIAENNEVIDQLTTSMLTSVRESTGFQEDRINGRLANLIPNATITFKTNVPEWVPSPAATVQTDVEIDGTTNDVSRQGHGIQRAVMIAMLQSLVPDEDYLRSQHAAQDGESEAESAARLASKLEDVPDLLICIEEPEIYQHPVRARAFARVLADLAQELTAQVLIATHSPYFARPEQFAGIRRFTLDGGVTTVTNTSLAEVATRSGRPADQVEKTVQKRLPTTFSEGFFADAVVLVEGDTDKAVVEALAEVQGRPLDSIGVSVLEMTGKGGLGIPAAVLRELNIPIYVVFDGDFNASDAINAQNSKRGQTEAMLASLPTSTAVVGTLPFTFGDPTLVCADYSIWKDDIEVELLNWPSFMSALQANGHTLEEKDALAVRNAVLEANTDDVPECLDRLVTAITDFRANA
jgi:putative ATP-dependent endonuclease of OLD family